MDNGIRRGDSRGSNKARSSKFRVRYRVRQTPEEGRWTYRSKRCRNNNKDVDYSPKTLNDKNPTFLKISGGTKSVNLFAIFDSNPENYFDTCLRGLQLSGKGSE